MNHKGWLAIATLKPTFTFLVGILSSKSIEYGKIPTKKVKFGFRVEMASQPLSAFLHWNRCHPLRKM